MRYIKPPDSLLTQLDVYTEEKFEDEEDARERTRNLINGGFSHKRARSDSEVALSDLIQLAKQHGELYPMMVEILKHYEALLQKDVDMYVGISLSLFPHLIVTLQSDESRLVYHLGSVRGAGNLDQ